jgi:hypothetical protein
MSRGRSNPRDKLLERQIAEVVLRGDSPPPVLHLSIQRETRDKIRGFRISGEDEFGRPIEFFVGKKTAADAIRDVYQEVSDPEDRLRRISNLLRWDAESSPAARSTVSAAQARPPTGPTAPATEQGALEMTRRAVLSMPSRGRFGPDKVFISAIYDQIAPALGWSIDQFKRWLAKANQEEALDLSRADGQGDMDADLVHRSEIVDRGATLHFVVDRTARAVRRRDWA